MFCSVSDPLSSRLFFNENGSSCLPIKYGHKIIPGHYDDSVSYLSLALEVALIGKLACQFQKLSQSVYVDSFC